MTPILMRADVLPGLLAPGLVLADGEIVTHAPDSTCRCYTCVGLREAEVDLRDPHTRDRVLRALWAAGRDTPAWWYYMLDARWNIDANLLALRAVCLAVGGGR